MLILLPLLTFVAMGANLYGWRANEAGGQRGWREAFLMAATFWGALATAFSESLSLFRALDRTWLAILWAVGLGICTMFGLRKGTFRASIKRLHGREFTPGRYDAAVLLGLALICGVLLAVAWVSPPNNVDSLLYHMARVVHWAQNHSLRHYATAYDHQLLKPIWAETAILNLRLTWGNDRPANLVQWFSMVGSLLGVSAIAGLLGAGKRGQLLAAAFAVSIPMGVLQATSTQNDYVAAFWVVTVAYFVLRRIRGKLTAIELFCFALAFGLGTLTKGTFFAYSPPFLIGFFLVTLRADGLRRVVGEAILIGTVAIALNAGFWSRNILTYGGPYGTSEWLQANLGFGIRFPWLQPAVTPQAEPDGTKTGDDGASPRIHFLPAPRERHVDRVRNASPPGSPRASRFIDGVGQWLARVLRTVGWNLITPFSAINRIVIRLFASLPFVYGGDYLQDVSNVAWNHEDTAGNPFHLFLVLTSLMILPFVQRETPRRRIAGYALMALATYALIPIVIGHGPSIWGIRYQLPFFVLWAPVAGGAFAELGVRSLARPLTSVLLIASVPWILSNNTRPVIGNKPWPTRIDSVFKASPPEILLAMIPDVGDEYLDATRFIAESGCRSVGLKINSGDPEYSFWWLLDAPQSGTRIESVYTYPHLQRYVDRDFKPCAILCTICGEGEYPEGFRVGLDLGSVKVFVRNGP